MGNNTQVFAQGTRFQETTAAYCLSVEEYEMFGKKVTRYVNLGGSKRIYGADGEELGRRVFFRCNNLTLVVWCPYGEEWTKPDFWWKYAGAEMFCTSSKDKDGNIVKNPKVLTMRALSDEEYMDDIEVPTDGE